MRRLGVMVISLIPAGMLILTISGRWRYGFFILVRWVVSAGAALLVLVAQDLPRWMWVMVGILILFNPFVPVHLGRDTWRVLDLLAAGIFIAGAFKLQNQPSSRQRSGA